MRDADEWITNLAEHPLRGVARTFPAMLLFGWVIGIGLADLSTRGDSGIVRVVFFTIVGSAFLALWRNLSTLGKKAEAMGAQGAPVWVKCLARDPLGGDETLKGFAISLVVGFAVATWSLDWPSSPGGSAFTLVAIAVTSLGWAGCLGLALHGWSRDASEFLYDRRIARKLQNDAE